MGRLSSRRTSLQTLNDYRLTSVAGLATYQVIVGSGGLFCFTNDFLVDEIPMITKGESVLYKYAVGGDAMLLEYCNMLNIENQHLYDSNEELSRRVPRLETALETLESRILHVDRRMEHCLSSHVYGDGSVENPFTIKNGDLRVSVVF